MLAFAAIIRVKTTSGLIVLENVPEDAVVEVDGERVIYNRAPGESIKIQIWPGEHGVLVKRAATRLRGSVRSLNQAKSSNW